MSNAQTVRLILSVCALVPLAALSSCNDTIYDDSGLVADVQILPTMWTDPARAEVATPNVIAVTAVIPYPCKPYDLAARATQSGSSITLRVEGRYQHGCPQDQTGTYSYRSEVVNVPSGTFQLRVVNTHREWALAPDTVFVGEIDIP